MHRTGGQQIPEWPRQPSGSVSTATRVPRAVLALVSISLSRHETSNQIVEEGPPAPRGLTSIPIMLPKPDAGPSCEDSTKPCGLQGSPGLPWPRHPTMGLPTCHPGGRPEHLISPPGQVLGWCFTRAGVGRRWSLVESFPCTHLKPFQELGYSILTTSPTGGRGTQGTGGGGHVVNPVELLTQEKSRHS